MKTAEEYANSIYQEYPVSKEIHELMIEFAKIHVEAALQSATHVLDVNNDADYVNYPTKRGILNAYPLTNIN